MFLQNYFLLATIAIHGIRVRLPRDINNIHKHDQKRNYKQLRVPIRTARLCNDYGHFHGYFFHEDGEIDMHTWYQTGKETASVNGCP